MCCSKGFPLRGSCQRSWLMRCAAACLTPHPTSLTLGHLLLKEKAYRTFRVGAPTDTACYFDPVYCHYCQRPWFSPLCVLERKIRLIYCIPGSSKCQTNSDLSLCFKFALYQLSFRASPQTGAPQGGLSCPPTATLYTVIANQSADWCGNL